MTSRAKSVYCKPRKYVVLDFETNNLDKGSALNRNNHIVLACWEIVHSDGSIQRKHQWADEYGLQALEKDVLEADFVVAHNAKFELQWLKRCGLELRDVLVFDTYLAEWVISGNRGWGLGLEATAQRYGLGAKLSLAAQAISLGMDPADIPREWLLPYCYKDVELCREIYRKQIEILIRDNLLHLVLTRNLCCSVLADIEFNGCQLDKEAVLKEYEVSIEEFHAVERELEALTGGINLSSPKQLGIYLYETLGFPTPKDNKGRPIVTSKGAPKTDTNTLALLKAITPEQEQFLALYKKRNRLDSLLSKNLEFFRLVCEQKDSVFYGVFQQGFTDTGRLSAAGRSILFSGSKRPRGVQLQNIPRNYKRLFTAHDDDYLIGEADGAQLEFRVAAELGNDSVATKEIIEGVDIHSFTSKVLTDAGEPTDRQGAKPQTFSPLYGGRGKTPAQKKYAEFFRNKYKGITAAQQAWCLEVLDKGFQINPYGMRFYWPGTRMSRTGYIDNTTSICNYSVQGFATAEIIPIALVYFWHRSRGMDMTIWNTIHDSIAVRLHKSLVDEFRMLSKQCLTMDVYEYLRDVYDYEFKVPLGVGVKIDRHWGASKVEEIWSVFPDGSEQYKRKE